MELGAQQLCKRSNSASKCIKYDKRINKFSYEEKELDLLKDLRQRVDLYNSQLSYDYFLKLLIQRRRFDLW